MYTSVCVDGTCLFLMWSISNNIVKYSKHMLRPVLNITCTCISQTSCMKNSYRTQLHKSQLSFPTMQHQSQCLVLKSSLNKVAINNLYIRIYLSNNLTKHLSLELYYYEICYIRKGKHKKII